MPETDTAGALGVVGPEPFRAEPLRTEALCTERVRREALAFVRTLEGTWESALEGRLAVVVTTAFAASAPPPLHQLPHESHEFSRLEGLGEEGVDTHVETALDLVLSAGADDGEGKVPRPRIGTEASGGAQPVEPGHDHIEGHDIGPHVMDHVQTFDTIGRGHDLDALQLEIDPDQLPDDLVVVHNKHPTGRA